MVIINAIPWLRRRFLIHAHDTDLWASYQPRLPLWSFLLAIVGTFFVLGAIVALPFGSTIDRVLLTIAGLLLTTPLIIMGNFAYQNKHRRAAVRQQVLDTVKWRGDEAVLDVGCGSGMLLNGAAARLTTGSAVGIDIWAEHSGGGDLELLMRHAQAENVAERITFQEADARKMPFDDGSFDVVLSSWAMHHISRSRQDFEEAAQEMLRVLKSGGVMVVVDTTHMVEALSIRMKKAGLQVEFQEATLRQMLVIGRKG